MDKTRQIFQRPNVTTACMAYVHELYSFIYTHQKESLKNIMNFWPTITLPQVYAWRKMLIFKMSL